MGQRYKSKEQEKTGLVMVETVACYGREIWTMRDDNKRKVREIEIDYLRKGCKVSR